MTPTLHACVAADALPHERRCWDVPRRGDPFADPRVRSAVDALVAVYLDVADPDPRDLGWTEHEFRRAIEAVIDGTLRVPGEEPAPDSRDLDP